MLALVDEVVLRNLFGIAAGRGRREPFTEARRIRESLQNV